MDKNTIWKWLILVVLLAGSLALVTPPFDKKDADGSVVRSGKIRLGLDLRGGTSFVVSIDETEIRREIRARGQELTDEAVDAEVRTVLDGAQERAVEVLRNRIDNLGIAEPIIYPGKDNRIVIQLPGVDQKKREEAEKSIRDVAFLEFRMVHENNDELTAKLFSAGKAPEGYRIAQVGGDSVYLKDPTFSDDKRDQAYRSKLGRFEIPDARYEFLMERDQRDGREVFLPRFVVRRRELTGDVLKTANVDFQQLGQPVVLLEFDGKGSKLFSRVTADYAPGGAKNPNPNQYRQLAIVLDGTLYSAPVIREAIHGGRAEISGSFTLTEANYLRNVLRAGSLPAPVRIVEKRFVAPSLGQDSIDSGMRAIVYGGVGVVLFMLVYYMLAGVIANLALLLNILLLPLGMVVAAGMMGLFARDASTGGPIALPVLTLPGIAGILLTIGMAVDANVLIFERIREEMKTNKRLWSSITAGYDRAFVTILDANLTTLITGVILFVFGSGPIRGFAVTLCAGILCSMFTALVVTKLFFQVLVTKTPIATLRMLSFFKENLTIDFVSKRKVGAVLSLAVIVVSWGIMIARGVSDPSRIFGVDFLGGTSVTFTFAPEGRVEVEKLRATLSNAGISEAHIQYQREMEVGGGEFLEIKGGAQDVEGASTAERMKNALSEAFPASGFEIYQEDEVGAQVGAELKQRAVWSILIALVGIVIYLAWRFELGFAMGAIAALVHDVLMAVGLYVLCGRHLSLPVVAALLTVVGYSVNDTIVVFDRIREDLKLDRVRSFKEICNLSINQTLNRTILTSLTTLIAVVMLLVFGGGAIFDFALTLLLGVLVGTYSSIFVATPVVLLWHKDRRPEFAK